MVKLNSRLTLETVNDEVLVLDSRKSEVHRLTGDAAAYVSRLVIEPGIGLLDDEVTAGLVSLGIVTDDSMSRRRLVATAARLETIGIVTHALPSAAAVSSGGGGGSFSMELNWGTATTATPTVRALTKNWSRPSSSGPCMIEFSWYDAAGSPLPLSGNGISTLPVGAFLKVITR